jgi:hypothetical protein
MRTAILLAIAIGSGWIAEAQHASITPPAGRYLARIGLPAPAAEVRRALGNVFDREGHERRILTGEEQRNGLTMPIVFTRELDHKFRIDFGGGPAPRRIVLNNEAAEGTIAAWQATPEHYELLETLASDSTEGFLYSFGTGGWVRWIGGGFRPEGTGLNYPGPYFDIFRQTVNDPLKVAITATTKLFLFDSRTKLLAKTRYKVLRGGASVAVQVSFSDWTQMGDQMVPGSIVRTEGDQQVFSVSIHSASSQPSQPDSLFDVEQ